MKFFISFIGIFVAFFPVFSKADMTLDQFQQSITAIQKYAQESHDEDMKMLMIWNKLYPNLPKDRKELIFQINGFTLHLDKQRLKDLRNNLMYEFHERLTNDPEMRKHYELCMFENPKKFDTLVYTAEYNNPEIMLEALYMKSSTHYKELNDIFSLYSQINFSSSLTENAATRQYHPLLVNLSARGKRNAACQNEATKHYDYVVYKENYYKNPMNKIKNVPLQSFNQNKINTMPVQLAYISKFDQPEEAKSFTNKEQVVANQKSSSDNNNKDETSIDCSKASSVQEKLICSDEELAKLDTELSDLYKQCLEVVEDKDSLKETQRNWLRFRNQCENKECLFGNYQERIIELSEELSGI